MLDERNIQALFDKQWDVSASLSSRGICAVLGRSFSLAIVDELVVVDEVVATPHGEPHAVTVFLDHVVGNFDIKNLQQRYSGVAVVVNVII